MATSALRTCIRKTTQTQRDDERLLHQGALEGVDGPVDEFRAVVHRLYRHAGRQTRADFDDLFLQVGDHFERVLAIAGHGNARHHFPFAVEFGEAAPFVRRQFYPGDVADQHRCALVALDH
jgi:hypothetical protein